MPNKESKEQRAESRGQSAASRRLVHLPAMLLLAALSIAWTWPLALHFGDHIPGLGGDNYSFLWNLWWMRKALSSPELDFFQSSYLFSPFGVDLINHPHTALQGYISATALGGLSVIQAENLYVVVSVFLNAVCAYTLVFDMVRVRRLALLARHRVRRLAVCRGASARTFRSADRVGPPVVRAVASTVASERQCHGGNRLRSVRGRERIRRVLPRRISRCLRRCIHVRIVACGRCVPRAAPTEAVALQRATRPDRADGRRCVSHHRSLPCPAAV